MDKQLQAQALTTIMAKFADKDALKDFINDHEIVKISGVREVENYDRGPDRKGLIVSAEEECSKNPSKILIDVKAGQPCTDQVYEAIYEIGKDCSKRVIIFTGEKNEMDTDNPAADEEVVSSLIANMNAYPLGLCLVKIGGRLKTEVIDLTEFDVKNPSGTLSLSDLPSKERFKQSEFWEVYFDSYYHSYRPWNAFRSGIDNQTSRKGAGWGFNGLIVCVRWCEGGAFFYAKSYTHQATELWNLKQAKLKERYPGRKMELVNPPGEGPRIHVEFWDVPLSWLLTASTEEKIAHAEFLIVEYHKFMKIIEEALNEVKGGNREPLDISVLEKKSEDHGVFQGVHN